MGAGLGEQAVADAAVVIDVLVGGEVVATELVD